MNLEQIRTAFWVSANRADRLQVWAVLGKQYGETIGRSINSSAEGVFGYVIEHECLQEWLAEPEKEAAYDAFSIMFDGAAL